METAYQTRRAELQTYFDETASVTWQKLTSNAPVSGIRATVRAGRDAMRDVLLNWLPHDLRRKRVLDAGCGNGRNLVYLLRAGYDVVAVDEEQRAQVLVKGGLGHVPVTFAELKSPKGHRVLVNGQPVTSWQTNWDAATQRWQIVCNVAAGEDREIVLEAAP